MEEVKQFLATLALFKGFPETVLKELAEKSLVKSFTPQEPIIRFGQPGEFLGIILEGRAAVLIPDAAGELHQKDTLEKGDFVGEMSLVTGEPTGADVVALEESTLCIIPQDVFSAFLAVNPVALQVIAKTITERLRKRQQDESAQAQVENAWRSAADPYGLALTPTVPMNVLVLNANRRMLQFKFFNTVDPKKNRQGRVTGLDTTTAAITLGTGSPRKMKSLNQVQAFQQVLALLADKKEGVITGPEKISAVGHRVAQGQDKYDTAVIIDKQVEKDIEKFLPLAPDNNPFSLQVIRACQKALPHCPQVAVFETGLHRKMPSYAYLYGLPYRLYEKDRIRRYGSHGISHHYVALQAAAYLKKNFRRLKIISCHLGHKASVCAIDHGRSIDVSTGFTQTEGLLDEVRPGDLDPGIPEYLEREKGYTREKLHSLFNEKSGLLGLSGISGDFLKLQEAANKGNPAAVRAIHTYCYRIRKYIGAYVAALGGLDALVFTGGIGTGSAWVRGLSCQSLYYMGIQVDDLLNKAEADPSGKIREISTEHSPVKVLVIPLDDERMVARETIRVLSYQSVTRLINQQKKREIPIEVSAHHVHLSQEDTEKLFGPGYQLTKLKELSQPGQFACQETVNLIGPKGRVDRLRVLGPVRTESQMEISITEEFKLGIQAPIRASGDLEGTPGITLEGTHGTVTVPRGVINALRHIHMTPEDTLAYGLKDRDIVMVKVPGDRELIFGDVLVRAHPDFRLAMHIDTDEANAANLKTGAMGVIMGIQDRR